MMIAICKEVAVRLKVLLHENTRTWARYISDLEFHDVNRFVVNQGLEDLKSSEVSDFEFHFVYLFVVD